MKKTLKLFVRNTFTDCDVIALQIPIERSKASRGVYSKLFKDMKRTSANLEKVNIDFIKITIEIHKSQNQRIILTRPNGVSLDMPDNLTTTDFKILDLTLQAKELSLP